MHIANLKVPQSWVKLEDLINFGRTQFKIEADATYYIHNNSDFTLYVAESVTVPTEDAQEIRIYAGKSAGYIKANGDLYVCSKLPEVYPYPSTISITFCNDIKATDATSIGNYVP